ncbi:MAG: serine/threonine-protein kinase [Burkholderiales bacterium]
MSTTTLSNMLGRYEVLGELGQGAMGTVYKGRDPLLDRMVAIKTVNLTLPREELAEYEARFYQEAKAAGSLSHRNIVTIYDIGRSERVAYMAMEFLEGQELRRLLQARTPIPLDQALEIAAQVADGLQYAHERHIIHRDIKPANIMVLTDSVVKITDFGIARMRTNEVKTVTGMILGSPKYMSPEQVSGKRADTRSDIFSLGVVLYEMLTGASPFVADNIHGVMYQTMNFTPPAPRILNPDLPDVLNYISAKALAKSLDDRYQHASDLAQDLRRAAMETSGTAVMPKFSLPVADSPFVAPVSPRTRQADTLPTTPDTAAPDALANPAASAERTSDTHPPYLTLSKAFDSFDATMRLAALTGAEKELEQFSETQKIEQLKAIANAKRAGVGTEDTAASTTWHKVPDADLRPNDVQANNHLKLIWVGSAMLAVGAAVLFLLL